MTLCVDSLDIIADVFHPFPDQPSLNQLLSLPRQRTLFPYYD